jgi:hypothetical protein
MKYDRVKNKFIKKLAENQGQITRTCEACNIGRETYYRWRKEHPDFAERCDKVEFRQTENVKLKLLSNAMSGNQRAIEFWLTNKSRGEFKKVERHEIGQREGEKINFNITIEKSDNGEDGGNGSDSE